MEFSDIPVLYKEVMEGMAVRADGAYIDGTVGGGGHSSGIAESLGDGGRLYCFDQDTEALAAALKRL